MGRILTVLYVILSIILLIRIGFVVLAFIDTSSKKTISYENGRIEGVNYKAILGPQRLLYIKDKNLFLLDNIGVKQITFDSLVDNDEYKISRDGKFLAWKSYKNSEGEETSQINEKKVPVKLSIISLTTNNQPKVIFEDDENASSSSYLLGFDFLGSSSSDIVYLKSNGDIWKLDTNTKQKSQILQDKSKSTYLRGDIKSNRAGAVLLIEKAEFGCLTREFYNLANQRIENYEHQGDCYAGDSVFWTSAGDGIISHNKNNSDCTNDGLWVNFIGTNKEKKIFPGQNVHIFLDSVSISNNNRWVASISQLNCSQNAKSPKEGIYLINSDGTSKLIYERFGKNVSWSSDGKKVTYLLHGDRDYDMYIVDENGRDNLVFLKSISSYKWLPILSSSNTIQLPFFF